MAIGDFYDSDKVVVGQAAVVFAIKDTALPDLSGWDPDDPFSMDFWNPSAGTDWTACGATDQGWTFGASKNTQTVTIEEQSTPVATTLTDQNITLAGDLSEDITSTLALALNGTSAATAATTTDPGYDLITLSDTPIIYAVGMVTVNAEGFGRLIYAPRWVQLQNVSAAYRRADNKRMYGAQFSTVCKTADIKIYNFTAAATG